MQGDLPPVMNAAGDIVLNPGIEISNYGANDLKLRLRLEFYKSWAWNAKMDSCLEKPWPMPTVGWYSPDTNIRDVLLQLSEKNGMQGS